MPALSGIGEMFIFISFGFLSHSLKNKTKKQNPGHALKNSPASNIVIKKKGFLHLWDLVIPGVHNV